MFCEFVTVNDKVNLCLIHQFENNDKKIINNVKYKIKFDFI